MPPQLRVLIFSHDVSGLGHTARALAIAAHLSQRSEVCTILLTDLPIIGRFRFPPHVDYVRLPGVGPEAAVLNLDLASTLKIRRKIIQGVLKTFRPDVLVLERDPASLPDEAERTLEFARQELAWAKLIWALPDIVGEPDSVIERWTVAGAYEVFDSLCDEIWVEGEQNVFDQASNYRFPQSLANKLVHTGYLRSSDGNGTHARREAWRKGSEPVVLLTVGGGAAGYPLVDSYVSFLESRQGRVPFKSVIVTGPMMRSREKRSLMARAEEIPGLAFHRFSRNMSEYARSADLVVSGGGYNTLCASLTYRKPAIVSPDLRPPNERLLRAQVFERLGLLHLVPPGELTPERLGEAIESAVGNGHAAKNGKALPLNGLERIGERIGALAGNGRSPAA